MTPDTPVRIDLPGKVVHLLGTAHVSQASVDAVRRAVADLGPDCVCVELDSDRLAALRNPERWKGLDLFRTLKDGTGSMLLANLALATLQKRLGLQTGVQPGGELLAAVEEAEARGTPVTLLDRLVRTTLLRAWRQTGAWKKIELLGALLASAFEKPDLGEEDFAKLREQDTLSALLAEVGEAMPAAKATLIDERDSYMAEGLRRA
ncbi:MAG: TraB/GumN family protein, partial [Actinomycetota bacterium]|nr:TraB/GumN family protein [Actinomycetota bacterium]